jgi:hypothetical protein
MAIEDLDELNHLDNSVDEEQFTALSALNLKALAEIMKLQWVLIDKTAECDPVMRGASDLRFKLRRIPSLP